MPIAEFEVSKAGTQAGQALRAWPPCRCSPTSSPAREGARPKPLVSVSYYLPPVLDPETNGRFALVEVLGTPDGSLYYRVYGRDKAGKAVGVLRAKPAPVTKGKEVVAFNETMTLAFEVEDYLTAGVETPICEPIVLPPGQMGNGIPASLVEMTVTDPDDPSKEMHQGVLHPPVGHARPGLADASTFPNGAVYKVAYDADRKPLGFELKMVDFQRGFDPGTEKASRFSSDVLLTDKAQGIEDKPIHISMNEPLTHRGYTFYQSSFIRERDPRTDRETGRVQSVLQVGLNPGRPVMYGGCLLVVLGAFVQFYMRAGVFSDGGRREREKAKARAVRQARANGQAVDPALLVPEPATSLGPTRPKRPSDLTDHEPRPTIRGFEPGDDDETIRLAHAGPRPRGHRPRRRRRPTAEAAKALGVGPAYETLARLPVLHEGRIKPLDTLAREEVKQIFGRETVKLQDASNRNKVVETWTPVAALYDWSVRPDHWDDQPFILVEYVPLKRLILADEVRARFAAVAGKATTSAADRAALEKLAADRELSAAKVDAFLAGSSLAGTVENPGDDRKSVMTLAAMLSEEHKWLTPRQLEDAHIADGGAPVAVRRLVRLGRPEEAQGRRQHDRRREADRGREAGVRGRHPARPLPGGPRPQHAVGRADAGHAPAEQRGVPRLPRPDLREGAEDPRHQRPRPVELDGAKALDTYWNELPMDERSVPGTDPKFDEPFAAWLRDSSAWVPLKAMLGTKAEDLAAAGFPLDKVEAFQQAFKDLDAAEDAAPGASRPGEGRGARRRGPRAGRVGQPDDVPDRRGDRPGDALQRVEPVLQGARGLPAGRGPAGRRAGLPGVRAQELCFARFGRADVRPRDARPGGGDRPGGRWASTDRVRISGWAPVTNMYETVIWVSAVAAVLGLVFELIYRKTFAALAGSGVALLGTVLAANVPLLDPDIKTLQPVLRSNYWLTIHVLTEVSSYGAFLLAAGLGLIATFYYLTATYRRSPGVHRAGPAGRPRPAAARDRRGAACSRSYGYFGPAWVPGNLPTIGFVALACVGGALTLAVPVGDGRRGGQPPHLPRRRRLDAGRDRRLRARRRRPPRRRPRCRR